MELGATIISWLLAGLFGLCFAGLAWSLGGAFSEAAKAYDDVYADDTARALDDIFLFIPPQQVLKMARIAAIAVALGCFLLFGSLTSARGWMTGLFFALLGGAATLQAPKVGLQFLRQRRRQKFNEQLVDALSRMSNSLKAGFSIMQSFESIVQEGQNPIAQEFGVFLHQTRVGVRFEEALRHLENRVGSEDLTLTVRAIEVARLTGGNLTDVFEKIAATIRERMRIEGRVRALTAQGRLQGIVVGIMPLLLLMAMTMLDPKMMTAFFGSPAGIALLVLVLVLETAGALLIRKLIRIEV